MAIDTPPIYSNIIYNSLFFPDANSTGFTQIQANALYLRKTVQDIDPFLATFQSGIKTNTVDTTDPTGATNCGLFTGATDSIIDIGPITAPALKSALMRIGTGGATTLQLGSNTSNCNIYNPILSTTVPANTDNSTKIISTAWINNWFGYVLNNLTLTWALVQTFTLGILTNSINPINVGGTLQIGQGSTTNNVEIASQASRSVILHLGDGDNNTSGGGVHIGNGVDSSNNVQILNGAYGATGVAGQVNILTGTHNALATGGNVNIHTGTCKGISTIGNSLSTTTINSAITNIANNGMAATDKVNICGGANATGSELFLGSTTLTRAFLRGVDVNINHQRAGNINIGADTLISTTNILGTTNIGSTSKVLTINAPMVVGYATSALTLPTQIGYTVYDTITLTGTIPSNANRYFFGAGGKVLPSGVWLIQFTTRARSAGTSTFTRYFTWGEDSITGTNPLSAMTSLSSTTVIDSEGLSTCGAFTVTSTGTTTYNIVIYFVYTGSAISFDAGTFGSTVKRTRLA